VSKQGHMSSFDSYLIGEGSFEEAYYSEIVCSLCETNRVIFKMVVQGTHKYESCVECTKYDSDVVITEKCIFQNCNEKSQPNDRANVYIISDNNFIHIRADLLQDHMIQLNQFVVTYEKLTCVNGLEVELVGGGAETHESINKIIHKHFPEANIITINYHEPNYVSELYECCGSQCCMDEDDLSDAEYNIMRNTYNLEQSNIQKFACIIDELIQKVSGKYWFSR
jgi:hypothetical protein